MEPYPPPIQVITILSVFGSLIHGFAVLKLAVQLLTYALLIFNKKSTLTSIIATHIERIVIVYLLVQFFRTS